MSPIRPLLKSYPMATRGAGLRILVAAILAGACQLRPGTVASTDEFGRLEGPSLFELAGRADARAHAQLTFREMEALPVVLRDERAPLVIVKTESGNLAKMVVSPGFRKFKPSEKDGPLVPVLVVERFETIDAGDHRSVKARGKELTLFDRFQLDLDTGQVVPEGLGGDVVFLTQAPDGPRLAALSGSRLSTLDKPPPSPAPAPGKPSSGRAIVPSDFAGRYSLTANGQWSGTLVLAVDPAGIIAGHFHSDRNGSAYPVTGQVAADIPQKVSFFVQFPRARQVYEGFLWTEGKNLIAGSVSMLEHPYSFIAIREGASLTADTIDLGALPAAHEKSARRVVRLDDGSDRYAVDGQTHSEAELTEILSKAVKAEANTAVLLRVSDAVPFERVRRAAAAIRGAGVSRVQLAVSTDTGGAD
jgi:hypothetical protein